MRGLTQRAIHLAAWASRWLPGSPHVLPDFLIIGTQKGGTSALVRYLHRHAQVIKCRPKEIHFFDLHYHEGRQWYLGHFPKRATMRCLELTGGGPRIVGEATPYYMFHPRAPRLIHEWLPDVKLVMLLRNPVERAHSQYSMSVRQGHERLSFEQAIDEEEMRLQGEVEKLLDDPTYFSYSHQHHSYLARGIYADQLQPLRQYFPDEHMLILKSEAFLENPQRQFDRVLDFLGLPPHQIDHLRSWNVGEYKDMSEQTRDRLISYFSPHNQRLRELHGVDIRWDR